MGEIMDKEEIREHLRKGNLKFTGSPIASLHVDESLREYLVENGQHPYAIVVACSDSRVNVEAIFSASLGDIFVIRSAGNVVLDGELSSIAYAVKHLHCHYVLVLGHTHCGAVDSALKGVDEEELRPLLDDVKVAIKEEVDPRKAEILNVRYEMNKIKKAIKTEGLTVDGAVYDILTGSVEFLD